MPNRWSGVALAAGGVAIGVGRLLAAGATDWLTWVWFVLAAVYAGAAVVVRRLAFPERPQDWLGRRGRRRGSPGAVVRTDHPPEGSDEVLTKNRIANGLAVLAAVTGMVLVITGAGGQKGGGDDDDAPASPTTSHVAPAGPGQPGQVGAPAQSQAPAPGQSQPAAPAKPKDDDGDDDDDN